MLNETLHSDLLLNKGDFFVKNEHKNFRIGKILKGVLRGFTTDNDGQEITTHIFVEEDLISGS